MVPTWRRLGLDQWAALVAVVEAAVTRGVAQLLSYPIDRHVHDQQAGRPARHTGVRTRGRRSVLTPAGQVLYRRGRALLVEAGGSSVRRQNLRRAGSPRRAARGRDRSFHVAAARLPRAEFGRERPDTRIELIESVLAGTDEALLEGRVDLAIGSVVPGGFIGEPLMQLKFVCAAAPTHPLHLLDRELTLDDLREHRHLVIRDSGARRTRSGGWLNEHRWTVRTRPPRSAPPVWVSATRGFPRKAFARSCLRAARPLRLAEVASGLRPCT